MTTVMTTVTASNIAHQAKAPVSVLYGSTRLTAHHVTGGAQSYLVVRPGWNTGGLCWDQQELPNPQLPPQAQREIHPDA